MRTAFLMLALGAVDRPEMQHQTPGLGLSALLTRVPTTTPTSPTDYTTQETRDNTTATTELPGNTVETAPTNDHLENRARRMMPDMR